MSPKLNQILIATTLFLPCQYGFSAVACNVNATLVNFGVYDPLSGTPDNITGTVTETCTLTPPPCSVTQNLTISLSAGSSGNFSMRTMKSGPNSLNYNLYRNSGRTQIWGDGSGETFTQTGSVNLTNTNKTRSTNQTIYGSIPALQTSAVPGSYSDTIIIKITY